MPTYFLTGFTLLGVLEGHTLMREEEVYSLK